MRSQVMERLRAAKNLSTEAGVKAREERDAGTLSQDALSGYLREYVLAKYRLDADKCPSMNLEQLAEASLAKTLTMSPDELESVDTAANCDGADSVTMKQALLVVAIQRDFEVELDGFEVAFLETVDDLAGVVWREMRAE